MSNMEEKLQEMMDTIRSTQRKLKADFTEQISKLKREVTVEQESSSQEVVKKLNKLTYHFQRKGNEAQYLFNSLVEDHLESTKKELAKQTPENDMQTAIVKRVKICIDEGTKVIEVCQEHMKLWINQSWDGQLWRPTKITSLRLTLRTERGFTKPKEKPKGYQNKNEHCPQQQPRGKYPPRGQWRTLCRVPRGEQQETRVLGCALFAPE